MNSSRLELLNDDDTAIVVEEKLRKAFGHLSPVQHFKSNAKPAERPKVGRPQASWYEQAFTIYVQLRRMGKTEQQAVGTVADQLKQEEEAVRKAMRTMDKEWSEEIIDFLMDNDFQKAASFLTTLEPYLRQRTVKWLNVWIRSAAAK